jgi:hypothetical protein
MKKGFCVVVIGLLFTLSGELAHSQEREPDKAPLSNARQAVLDSDVLSFCVAKLAQSQLNGPGTGGLTSWVERR